MSVFVLKLTIVIFDSRIVWFLSVLLFTQSIFYSLINMSCSSNLVGLFNRSNTNIPLVKSAYFNNIREIENRNGLKYR